MPAIIEEIAPHPVYDEHEQHDEVFANVRFYKEGRAYASLRIHLDEIEEGAGVGDEVKLTISRRAGQ